MSNAQIIRTIRNGYRIQTATDVFTVAGSMKMRSGQKYVCKTEEGRTITIDREDLLEAQRDGSAIVIAAR